MSATYTIYVCPECGSISLVSPGCTHLEGVAEVFGSEVPKERTVAREAVAVATRDAVLTKAIGDEGLEQIGSVLERMVDSPAAFGRAEAVLDVTNAVLDAAFAGGN